MKRALLGVAILLLLAAPRFAIADDVWDLAGGGPGSDDQMAGSTNELRPGTVQVHDLQSHAGGVMDIDLFTVDQRPYSSYEAVVDGENKEVVQPALDLLNITNVVLQSSVGLSQLGNVRSLRLRNSSASEDKEYVRVMPNLGCQTACTTNANYRIELYETTYMIPRFNNNATQATILIIQNSGTDTVDGAARFWSNTGVLLGSSIFTLGPKATSVVNTSSLAGIAGQSGSITVDHTGSYGSLSGKAVAVEPATGFTFDTAMVAKPR
jgi:hypothetical protein